MHKRNSIIIGTILIVVGLLFLVIQLFPGLAFSLDIGGQWPLIIVSIGVLLILSALFGSPALAIPGSVVSGIGGILYVQNVTDTWSSWAYIWTLIPGFVGIGLILAAAAAPSATSQAKIVILFNLKPFQTCHVLVGAKKLAIKDYKPKKLINTNCVEVLKNE